MGSNNYFASGKVYSKKTRGSGHNQTGYFHSSLVAGNEASIEKALDSLVIQVAEQWGVSKQSVHIEQFNKL